MGETRYGPRAPGEREKGRERRKRDGPFLVAVA
jgi:hypothetical protein